MKKTNILLFTMLIFLCSFVTASHTLTFPNYFETNVSERISITNGEPIVDTAFLFLEGDVVPFGFGSGNNSLELFINNDEEEDLAYFIQIFNSSITGERTNTSDDSRESFLNIDDTDIYGVVVNHSLNHTINQTHNHDICPNIRRQTGNPIVKAVLGVPNKANLSEYLWSESAGHSYDLNSYNFFCIDIPHISLFDINESFEEIIGFYCTNCDAGTRLLLGLDTDNITNKSLITQNFTSNFTNITNGNFMMINFELSQAPVEEFFGVFKFRVPFYLNITLYETKNQTFTTNFDYIYLKRKEQIPSSELLANTDYSGFANDFSQVFTFGLFNRGTIDFDEVFWGEVNQNSAFIKLYEPDNYTVTLLSVKTFLHNGWMYEFLKPQYTNLKVETTLDGNLAIINNVNLSANIFLTDYEANKSGALFNFVKILIAIILLAISIGVSFFSGYPQALGVLIPVWLIIIKFMGINI